MKVSIAPEFEEFINQEINEGIYSSVNEVIKASLLVLKRRDEITAISDEELKTETLKFLEDIAKRGIFEFEADDYFLLSQELKRRKIERLKNGY